MFERILCAIDFSAASDHALDLAVAWAKHEKCSLTLVHVWEPVVPVGPEVMLLASDFEERSLADLEKRMQERVTKLRSIVASTTGYVARGIVANEIVARAEREKADLIVLGTHGSSALARVVIGSVADRVARASAVPVILVPRAGREVSPIPKLIVTPTDFSSAAKHAVMIGTAMARAVGARLDVIHAYHVPKAIAGDQELMTSLQNAMRAEVRSEHPELARRADVGIACVDGAPPAAIVALCERASADLVIMSSTGRGPLAALLFGSTTDRMLRTSHIPVMLIPPKASSHLVV